MAIMTYLEIVNKALVECKVSLDPLTAANFEDPPRTGLYNHFKRWANDVYKELMLERPQWFFRSERTTVQLKPRLHLSGLTYLPSVGDVLQGQESGVKFTVLAVYTFEDNEADPTIQRTVDVRYEDSTVPSDLEINEVLDLLSPSLTTGVGYVAHAGRYNFSEITGFDELVMDSVKGFFDNNSMNAAPLTPVDWINWVNRYSYYPFGGSSARPEYITRAPDGNYEMYPQPIDAFYLEFDFVRTYPDMTDYTDTPVGVPDKYQDILVWKTVAEYADFDNNTRMFARAAKKLNMYDYYLARDELPELSFAHSKFNINNGR